MYSFALNQVLEDVIKHADHIVDSYVTSQYFCITLSTAVIVIL